MLVVLGTIRLPPANVSRALPIMARMIEASRLEPGCLDYSYARDVLDAGLIRVMEVWADRAALDAHFHAAHTHAWREAWPGLGITDRALLGYEVLEAGPV